MYILLLEDTPQMVTAAVSRLFALSSQSFQAELRLVDPLFS